MFGEMIPMGMISAHKYVRDGKTKEGEEFFALLLEVNGRNTGR